MKQIMLKAIMIFILPAIGFSCHHTSNHQTSASSTEITDTPVTQSDVRVNVLTAQDQVALTPDRVIENLKNGNRHYTNNKLTVKNDTIMMHKAYKGQYPEAFVLSCIDSRVMVEEVFDLGIGDIFVGRVAGNFVNDDLLGSMEYACKLSGAKLIVVLGHESCGAIKAAIEHEKLGNITAMLAHIEPAITQAKEVEGEHTIENHDYVEAVAWNNVNNTIQTIKERSPVLKELADKGTIKIIGAYYRLNTGEVVFR